MKHCKIVDKKQGFYWENWTGSDRTLLDALNCPVIKDFIEKVRNYS